MGTRDKPKKDRKEII